MRVGIFDSGIGGLTVAAEVARSLPSLDIAYLGDTARLPYGAKSPETVTRYALGCVSFLYDLGIEALVVACNTASAHALPALRERWPLLPVLGVVEPGARAAVAATRTGCIGVIGTEGTIRSRSYERALRALTPEARVVARACPRLVPLAEVGWLDHEVTRRTLEIYLEPMLAEAPIDALVLGCTHYPALKPAVRAVLSRLTAEPVALVDSAEVVTAELAAREGAADGGGTRRIYVTDLPERFAEVASRFWPGPLPVVRHVDLPMSA